MLSANTGELSISRILGHKETMPHVGRWRLNKKKDNLECWHCCNWIFTLVLWNEQIGIHNGINNLNIEVNEKKRVVESIREHDEKYTDNPEVPILFSNVTNWHG